MYPLNVILIGHDQGILPQVRRELLSHPAYLEAEFPNLESVADGMRLKSEWTGGAVQKEKTRLFVIHLKRPGDLAHLKALSGMFVGQPILALVDAGNDQTTLLQAMREGASQVVLVPLQAQDFRAAMERI